MMARKGHKVLYRFKPASMRIKILRPVCVGVL
jgi:hypothetical protein